MILDKLYAQFSQDPVGEYMSKLPPLSKSFENPQQKTELWQEQSLIQNQNEFNILCIGVENCRLEFYAFGLFHIGWLKLERNGRIVNILPSSDLKFYSVIFRLVVQDR